MSRTLLRRSVIVLAILGTTMSVTHVAPAQAAETGLCYVTIEDHTPGVYPGGMHVHTNCM